MPIKEKIPKFIESVLWSYDVNKIDFNLHKKLIISQVLNYGTEDATDWLFRRYTTDLIRKVAQKIPNGQWNKKSLALWSLCLNIRPKSKKERVLHE